MFESIITFCTQLGVAVACNGIVHMVCPCLPPCCVCCLPAPPSLCFLFLFLSFFLPSSHAFIFCPTVPGESSSSSEKKKKKKKKKDKEKKKKDKEKKNKDKSKK